MAGGKAPRRRLRIAVLLDHLNSFSGGYEAQLRDAIHAKCREAGHHLLLVYGGPVEAPQPLDAADNAIYELLRPDSVDGIIVVSSLLSTYCGPSGVARLVERFAHARMCSIGIELPGVPSLVLDNRPGMEAVVEHLIRDHGRRRIAFLAGTPENPEAKVRFDAYQTRAGTPWHRLRSSPDGPRATSAPTRPRWPWRRSSRAVWTSTASWRRTTRWRPAPSMSCASRAGACPRTFR